MTSVLTIPILGIPNDFPSDVFVIHTSDEKPRFACYDFSGSVGLACFEEEVNAKNFKSNYYESEEGGHEALYIRSVSWEEARKIGKERPHPVNCILVLDDINNPIIHIIK